MPEEWQAAGYRPRPPPEGVARPGRSGRTAGPPGLWGAGSRGVGARGVDPWVADSREVDPKAVAASGGVKASFGCPASAVAMVLATATLTLFDTPEPTMSCGLSGFAAMAAAASCGVNPTNVSVAYSLRTAGLAGHRTTQDLDRTLVAVPPSHLPNTGLIADRAARRVGRGPRHVAAGAPAGSSGPPRRPACPSGSVIDSTGSGAQYIPSAATVAYALASSSGVVSATPRVNDAPARRVRARPGAASASARNVMPEPLGHLDRPVRADLLAPARRSTC